MKINKIHGELSQGWRARPEERAPSESAALLPLRSRRFSSSFSLFCIRRSVFSASCGTANTGLRGQDPFLDCFMFSSIWVSTAKSVLQNQRRVKPHEENDHRLSNEQGRVPAPRLRQQPAAQREGVSKKPAAGPPSPAENGTPR